MHCFLLKRPYAPSPDIGRTPHPAVAFPAAPPKLGRGSRPNASASWSALSRRPGSMRVAVGRMLATRARWCGTLASRCDHAPAGPRCSDFGRAFLATFERCGKRVSGWVLLVRSNTPNEVRMHAWEGEVRRTGACVCDGVSGPAVAYIPGNIPEAKSISQCMSTYGTFVIASQQHRR